MNWYQINCHYSQSCFCQRAELPGKSEPLPTEPRWNFRKDVLAYCQLHGLRDVVFNSKDKSALAVLDAPCQHRQEQSVRIGWNLA